MKLSTTGRCAVMAVVDLAQQSNGRPIRLADFALRQEVSVSHLQKLFIKLRRRGLVKSVRGPGGGYLLSMPANETRVSDVIMAVDEPIRTTRCTPDSPGGCRANQERCSTHELWEALGNHIFTYLSSITIADVCEKRVNPGDIRPWVEAEAGVSVE